MAAFPAGLLLFLYDKIAKRDHGEKCQTLPSRNKEVAMLPRILWFAGLAVALLAPLDQASARSRRFLSRPIDMSSGTVEQSIYEVTYPVADLVGRVPALRDFDVAPLPSRLIEKPAGTSVRHASLVQQQTTEAILVNHLLAKVAPSSWNAAGGRGTIQYLSKRKTLVVSQTALVHEEIAAALAALRDQQQLEIALDCRIIQIPTKGFEQTRNAMNLDCLEQKRSEEKPLPTEIVAGRGNPWTSFLNEEQVRQLLDLLTKEPTSQVNQRTVIATFSGQHAALETIEHGFYLTGIETNASDKGQTFSPRNEPIANGLRLALRPDVSADHRFVRLKINGYWSQLVGPVHLIPIQMPVKSYDDDGKETGESAIFQLFLQQPVFGQIRFNQQVNVPDGGSVLVHGGIVPCKVKGPEWAAWLTWLWDEEEWTTWEDHHIFLMVTPRIVAH